MNKIDFGNFLVLLAISSYPGVHSCPDLWIAVGDRCYLTSPAPMTWYQAEEFCGLDGGYLTEIHDDDEQASLLSFLPYGAYYWIGLADFANANVWKWQTGYDEANYTFWYPGQPDGIEGDCVMLCLDGWMWCDFNCYGAYSTDGVDIHALCEMANED